MIRFDFHPDARDEYLAAADYYERQRPGLAAGFSLEIETVIEKIIEAPERWPVVEQDVRRCLARRFPFANLYCIESGRILIVSVMHCSREPGYWKTRTT